MSNVAKFLIIVNLLLAGVFVGSAANFLGQKDYVQSQLEQDLSTQKGKTAAVTSQLTASDAKNVQLSNENSNLKTQNSTLEQAKSDTEKQNQALAAQQASQGASLTHATAALELLNGQLRAMEEAIKNLQDERTKLAQSRDTEHTARVSAEAMTATLQRQLEDEVAAHKGAESALADANRKGQELDAEVQAWRSKFPGTNQGQVQPAMPPGKVLAADNAMGLVVTSLGEEDGVKPGYEYIVSRGNQYVATIKVTDVQAKKSTARVVKDMQKSPIQANDTVLNR